MMHMPDFGISGRTALIVGSSGNVGRHVARELVLQGTRLVCADRTAQKVEGALQTLGCDLSGPAGVADLHTRSRDFAPVELLVVTSGLYRGGQPIESTDPADFEDLYWANAGLPWNILRVFMPDLVSTRGHAVLIGALGAERQNPRQTPYNASKSALHSVVETAAKEVSQTGATINALLPLVIDHEVNRRARPSVDPELFVSPERLGQVAAFLLSDMARDINGALIPVPGRI